MITMPEGLFVILMLVLAACTVVGWALVAFSTIGPMLYGYTVLFKMNVE